MDVGQIVPTKKDEEDSENAIRKRLERNIHAFEQKNRWHERHEKNHRRIMRCHLSKDDHGNPNSCQDEHTYANVGQELRSVDRKQREEQERTTEYQPRRKIGIGLLFSNQLRW